ncbi:coiled-coil domain-containing protein [Acrasis kona]|uniref:Coiled-coil domain-containing protein n=1 Tax=Acrasis kona TaxID=1008807 RepID=A0AAW2YX42_9EUKA
MFVDYPNTNFPYYDVYSPLGLQNQFLMNGDENSLVESILRQLQGENDDSSRLMSERERILQELHSLGGGVIVENTPDEDLERLIMDLKLNSKNSDTFIEAQRLAAMETEMMYKQFQEFEQAESTKVPLIKSHVEDPFEVKTVIYKESEPVYTMKQLDTPKPKPVVEVKKIEVPKKPVEAAPVSNRARPVQPVQEEPVVEKPMNYFKEAPKSVRKQEPPAQPVLRPPLHPMHVPNPFMTNPMQNPYMYPHNQFGMHNPYQMNPGMYGMQNMMMGGNPMSQGGGMMNGLMYKMIQKQMNATELLLNQHEVESKQLQNQLVELIMAQKVQQPAPLPASTEIVDESQMTQEALMNRLKFKHQMELMELEFQKEKLNKVREFDEYRDNIEQQKILAAKSEQERIYKEKLERERREIEERRHRAKTIGYKAIIEGTAEAHESQTSGFQLYLYYIIDYVTGLHSKVAHIHSVYNVYDGTQSKTPQRKTPVTSCEVDAISHKRSLIMFRRPYPKVSILKNLKIIVDMQSITQLPTSVVEADQLKGSSICWTVIEIFNSEGALNTGFWRVPMYDVDPSIDPSMTPFTIDNNFGRSGTAQLYYRIVAPPQFDESENLPLNPEITSVLYKIPPGYIRTIAIESATEVAVDSTVNLFPTLANTRPGQINRNDKSPIVLPEEKKVEPPQPDDIVSNHDHDLDYKPNEGMGILINSFGPYNQDKTLHVRTFLYNGSVPAINTKRNVPFLWETGRINANVINEDETVFTYEWRSRTVFKNYPYHKQGNFLFQVVSSKKEDEKTVRKILFWASHPIFEDNKLHNGNIKLKLFDNSKLPFKHELLNGEKKEDLTSKVFLDVHTYSRINEPKVEKTSAPAASDFNKGVVKRKTQYVVSGEQPLDNSSGFRKGLDGFYVYFDGARFLPYNCTVSRASLILFDGLFRSIEQRVVEFQLLEGESLTPPFVLSEEYIWKNYNKRNKNAPDERGFNYDPTMTLLIKLETIDVYSRKYVVVGFGCIALFVTQPYSNQQVTDSEQERFYLNEGAFQIPICMAPLPIITNFSEEAFNNLATMTYSTMLVRITRMTKREKDDRKSSLVSRLERDPETHVDVGLYTNAPDYSSGMYDTSRIDHLEWLKDPSHFKTRVDRSKEQSVSARTALRNLLYKEYESITIYKLKNLPKGEKDRLAVIKSRVKKMDNSALYEEMSKLLFKKSQNAPDVSLDYTYVADYIPTVGFYVAMDGLINLPLKFAKKDAEPTLFKTMYRVFPQMDTKSSNKNLVPTFSMTHDMSSSIRSPYWNDPPKLFKNIAFSKTRPLYILIEIRSMINPMSIIMARKTNEDVTNFKSNKSVTTIGSLGWTIVEVFVDNVIQLDKFKDKKQKSEKKKKEDSKKEDVGKVVMEPFIKSAKMILPVFQGQLTEKLLSAIIDSNSGMGKKSTSYVRLNQILKEACDPKTDVSVLSSKYGLQKPLQHHDGVGLVCRVFDAQRKHEFSIDVKKINTYKSMYMDVITGVETENPMYYIEHNKANTETTPLNSFMLSKAAWQYLFSVRKKGTESDETKVQKYEEEEKAIVNLMNISVNDFLLQTSTGELLCNLNDETGSASKNFTLSNEMFHHV